MAAFAAYLDAVVGLIERIKRDQGAQIAHAAAIVASALSSDGLVHTFGTGHSHLLAEEAFFRAGGLAAVNPIRDRRLMMLEGVLASTDAEREEGLAQKLIEGHHVRPGDAAIVISNSGRNAVPIEMAIAMRERGARVIVITSAAHSHAAASRHASGARLLDLADVLIDNLTPPGDALVILPGIDSPVGPGSTVAGAAIVNAILVEAAAIAAAEGQTVAVLRSANLDGTRQELEQILERYRGRVPALFTRCT